MEDGRRKGTALLVSGEFVGLHLDLLLPLLGTTRFEDIRVALATVATRLIICTAPNRYLPTATIDELH